MDRNIGAEPLPRRLEATDADLSRAREAAHAIAAMTLGREPGPMTTAASMSHYVFIGLDVVVKLVDADGHTRLDREIALAPHLPPGLGAPLLGSGRYQLDTCDVRYACFTRVPGTSPGAGLPGVDEPTAKRLAEQAVQRLNGLHTWTPTGYAAQALRESVRHEGFASRAEFRTEIEHLIAADRDAIVPRRLSDGLTAIAQRAPLYLRADIPVHADGDWGNWLADEHNVTLLDFERARLGDPADDWMLLAIASGPHRQTVLDVIADATTTSPEILRTECELRDAMCLAQEIRYALEQPDTPSMDHWVHALDELIVGRRWWRI